MAEIFKCHKNGKVEPISDMADQLLIWGPLINESCPLRFLHVLMILTNKILDFHIDTAILFKSKFSLRKTMTNSLKPMKPATCLVVS